MSQKWRLGSVVVARTDSNKETKPLSHWAVSETRISLALCFRGVKHVQTVPKQKTQCVCVVCVMCVCVMCVKVSVCVLCVRAAVTLFKRYANQKHNVCVCVCYVCVCYVCVFTSTCLCVCWGGGAAAHWLRPWSETKFDLHSAYSQGLSEDSQAKAPRFLSVDGTR